MSEWEEIERFRALVLDMGLPRHEMAYFGVLCPYCGKSDRIHRLERPAELDSPPADYARLWEQYGRDGEPVVCKFCHQLLRFDSERGRVTPLTEI
jgi:uncharacterized Zn-finger protein